MAAPTAGVPSTTTPYSDTKRKMDLAAAAATYYPGEMIARDASGNAVKCSDTAGLAFAGIQCDSFRITVDSGDAAGDKKVTVDRPLLFSMKIAAAVAGDEGKSVYAVYSNEVGYSSSHSIQVGWVDRVISATEVEIRPIWAGVNGNAVFDGNTLTFTGATGVNVVAMPDNLADGLSVKEGSNAYLTFTTTDSSEAIALKKNTGVTGTLTVTSAAASAFAVGRLGATTPSLAIDASTSTCITGLLIKSAGTGGGLAVTTTGGAAEALTIDSKGTGTLTLNGTATGAIVMGANVTISTKNIVTDTSTGTKIGTATTQKLGFFNATPVVQPAASTDATTGASGSVTGVFLNTTFTGGGTAAYTVGGVVLALKALGLLAP